MSRFVFYVATVVTSKSAFNTSKFWMLCLLLLDCLRLFLELDLLVLGSFLVVDYA
jgi:hypothetical protein